MSSMEEVEDPPYKCDCDPPGYPLTDFTGKKNKLPKNTTGALIDFNRLDKEGKMQFLNSFDTILADCDGVLWSSKGAIPGSSAVINRLQEKGRKVFYLTNNSTRTRKEHCNKAHKLGFKATEESFVSTAFLTAEYLNGIGFKKKCFVVGLNGIVDELDKYGIQCIGVGPLEIKENFNEYLQDFHLDPEVGAVIVGFDPFFSLPKCMFAASYLNQSNTLFIATNTDEVFPNADNKDCVIPGSGMMVAAVSTAAGRKPDVILGKPFDFMYNTVAKQHQINPKRTLMIGDRANTDILFGRRHGLQTLLVLTGITTAKECADWKESKSMDLRELVPDFYVRKLGDFEVYLDEIDHIYK